MDTYQAAHWSSDPSRLSSSDEEDENRDTGADLWTDKLQAPFSTAYEGHLAGHANHRMLAVAVWPICLMPVII
jgi:hypothetical protein